MEHAVLLIGTPVPALRELGEALDAEWLEFPSFERAEAEDFEAFRLGHYGDREHDKIVVALWADEPRVGALTELDDAGWQRRAERPLIGWNVAMGVASRCVADEGAVVALIEAPAPIDSAGWTPECGVAEGAIVLARSIAQSEGERGVRANAVTTCTRLGGGELAPPPALAGRYPGSLVGEVSGAVRLLLSDDARGMTAGVTHVDCGRTLR